jgi:hypothetical protein
MAIKWKQYVPTLQLHNVNLAHGICKFNKISKDLQNWISIFALDG